MSKMRFNHVTINCASLSMDWRIEVNKRKLKAIRDIKSVPIMGRRFTIHQVSRPMLNGETVWGLCSYTDRKIYIEKDLDDVTYCETLCHEISHAISGTFGGCQTMTKMELEIFAQSFGIGFSDFILNGILK